MSITAKFKPPIRNPLGNSKSGIRLGTPTGGAQSRSISTSSHSLDFLKLCSERELAKLMRRVAGDTQRKVSDLQGAKHQRSVSQVHPERTKNLQPTFNPDLEETVNRAQDFQEFHRGTRTYQPSPNIAPADNANRGAASQEQSSLPLATPRSDTQQAANDTSPAVDSDPLRVKWRQLNEVSAGAVLAAVLAVVSLTFAVFGFLRVSGDLDRADATVARHQEALIKLQRGQHALREENAARWAKMVALAAEIKYPPSALNVAQDAMKAGRYADAEASFVAYLNQYPNGIMADSALYNAAISAAARGSCNMADAYLAKLKARHPGSPHLANLPVIQAECRKLRPNAKGQKSQAR